MVDVSEPLTEQVLGELVVGEEQFAA